MTVFEAYITNLGKYAEGQLVGETLKFPATTEEVQSLLKNIGVDGVRYEEFFITAFDGDVMGLYDYLTEYENLDELNHLAHLISELDSDEIETLEALLNKGDHIAHLLIFLIAPAQNVLVTNILVTNAGASTLSEVDMPRLITQTMLKTFPISILCCAAIMSHAATFH